MSEVVTISQDGADDGAAVLSPSAAAPFDASDPAMAGVAVLRDEADEDDGKFPKHAIRNDDGSVTLPLNVPVTLRWTTPSSGVINEDPTIERLVMRRLSGKDVRTVLGSGMGDSYLVHLTGACVRGMAEIKPGRWKLIFDQMDGSDTQAAILVAQHFLANGPKTPGG